MKLKILLSVMLAIICTFLYGQNKIQGYILAKQSAEPLPYATIGALHQKYGCYADTSGLFTLYFLNKMDSLKISYLGYKSICTTVQDLQNNTKILLEVNLVQLKEVVITPSKSKQKVIAIGFFTKKGYSVQATSYPLNVLAIFIPFPKNCNNIFIKSITFAYEMTYRNYPIRVRILKVKSNGEPGDDIVAENVVLSKFKPHRLQFANIDISKYNIYMPSNGVFVALEWIMDNPPLGSTKHAKRDGPYIGLVKTINTSSRWIGTYNQSKWEKTQTQSTLSIGLNVINYNE